MSNSRLRDDVWLQVIYHDATAFGSVVSGQLEARLKDRFSALVAPLIARRWQGLDGLRVQDAMSAAAADLYHGVGTLRQDFLYPDPRQVRPQALAVHDTHGELGRVALTPQAVARLADIVGQWQCGPCDDDDALTRAVRQLGAFTQDPPQTQARLNGVVAVGHACALVAGEQVRVLVDPFLPPSDGTRPYRPATLSQLAADVVLVTHSHPDHFDPGTLLRLGADHDIVVPCVPRESALSIDMAQRLRDLGFRKVHALAWHQVLAFGDTQVRALPFHGEQAGQGERLHHELRNEGNLYTVRAPAMSVAFTADSGRDQEGDLACVASSDRQQHGRVDVVFAGSRAWSLYPAQLLCSSIRRHALFIPRLQWTHRHQLMAGVHEAMDAAERWGARWVVPYADGGAPWYWAQGLGPDLTLPLPGLDDERFDPPPQALAHAAAVRSNWGDTPIASPVRVRLLRPGEALTDLHRDSGAVTAIADAQRWPYPRVHFDAAGAPLRPESLPAVRKKTLLRILAQEVGRERALSVTPSEVQGLSDTLRRIAGLDRREDMLAWMARANLSAGEFADMMGEWALCNQLEARYASEIDQRLPGQLALHAMRHAARAGATPS